MKRLVFVSKACKLPVRFQQCAGQSWMADYGWEVTVDRCARTATLCSV